MVRRDGHVFCEPSEPYDLQLTGEEGTDAYEVFCEFAGVGKLFRIAEAPLFSPWSVEAISDDADDALDRFIQEYGVPTDYSRDLPVSMSVASYRRDVIAHDGPVGELNEVKRNAVIAAQCFELDEHVTHRQEGRIEDFFLSGEKDVYVPHGKSSHEPWREFALDVLWENACLYTPSVGVKYQRTETGRQSVCVLNGLLTAMWLAFQMSLPGDDVYVTRTCLSGDRKDGQYRGCGREFMTTNPRARLCPECSRRVQAERKRKQRARQASQN